MQVLLVSMRRPDTRARFALYLHSVIGSPGVNTRLIGQYLYVGWYTRSKTSHAHVFSRLWIYNGP